VSEQVSVTREIAAPAERVWELVSDVTRMGEWSPENTGAQWLGGATKAASGAKFRGTNQSDKRSWKTVATVVDCTPGRAFSFHVKAGPFDIAEWRYDFEPAGAGCTVTETWTDRRGGLMRWLGGKVSGVDDRAAHNRAGMQQTLDRVAAEAEATAA
jgi:uncharacterized protein YndB with AHSA1/START domain